MSANKSGICKIVSLLSCGGGAGTGCGGGGGGGDGGGDGCYGCKHVDTEPDMGSLIIQNMDGGGSSLRLLPVH